MLVLLIFAHFCSISSLDRARGRAARSKAQQSDDESEGFSSDEDDDDYGGGRRKVRSHFTTHCIIANILNE
jgi:hypothetical protein